MFNNHSDRERPRSTTFTRLSFSGFAGWIAFLFVLIAATTGARIAAAQAPTPVPLTPLGIGDTVQIVVYGQSDLGETVYVADDGTVAVPLVGPVSVVGLSPAEAAKRIEKGFRDGKFVNDPHVTITVTKSRSELVSVVGAVTTPGRYPVDSRMTVLDLLALAGGINEETAGYPAQLIRTNADGTTTSYPIDVKGGLSDPSKSVSYPNLQGGDRLVVPEAAKFFVDGEVKSTGKFRLEPGMTIRQAIARAGGITSTGSMHRVDITRKDDKGRQFTRHARLDDPVQPDDVIRVKESIF
jgi:polysaccharide biosynthesis/export protein